MGEGRADARWAREQDFHDRAYGTGQYYDDRTAKYYAIARDAYRFYEEQLHAAAAGATVLEYGCGEGSYAFELARTSARVTGIDISPVAIEHARARAREEGVEESTRFEVMPCEDLAFPDRSFDLICGGGILHHLDLTQAYPELSRTLRADGRAVFLEPMGHNPVINLYRRRTPELRTEDEHPLLQSDLAHAHSYFEEVEARFFNLLSLAAVPLRGRRGFERWNSALDLADQWLFRRLPRLRKHAWMVALMLSGPRSRE
jgi:SAM-dependent methyltransferase